MYSPMPVYSYNEPRSRTVSNGPSRTPEFGQPSTAFAPTAPINQNHHNVGDPLEPVIDSPPSPGRIRVFSHHAKRDSSTDKHRSELTTSSGASSRLSTNSDKQSWNQSMESLSLSRNPSRRSSSGGISSRERLDSVQFFGKGIFNRKGKLRKGSTDQTSSNSSLDVMEASIDPTSATKDQPFIQSVFTRRKAQRGEAGASSQKKLQISGPYNFQHLTHTHKDSVPDLDRTSRMELVSEFSSMRTRRTTEAFLETTESAQVLFAGFSSESFTRQKDPSSGLNNRGQTQSQQLPPPPLPPIESVNRFKLQDKNRVPPPRPPRSPTDSGIVSQVLPPRTSSRVSVRHDRFGSLSGVIVDRPASTTGFRQPQPFTPTSPTRHRTPSTSIVSPIAESDLEVSPKFPCAITTPDDAAWPLTNSANPLPEVPEEEEHHSSTRPTCMSAGSNHSSLRGSISVPLLRQFTLTQSPQRSPSNASDTLGKFDFSNSQRALQMGSLGNLTEGEIRDSWEDDIDYCYEHEAEANCDYAWERPSCDMRRGNEHGRTRMVENQAETIIPFPRLSAGFLSPGSADVPVLSPTSQVSNRTSQEAVTPTNLGVPVTSNFSLPRRDSSAQLLRENSRNPSPERSFRESQGFSLSPSLLIPNDYHQQMLEYEREELEDSDDEGFVIQGPTIDDGPITKFGQSLKPTNVRSSASTTDSILSESTTFDRHKSTTSNSTAYTRWTGSSTSSWQVRDSSLHVLPKPTGDSGPIITIQPNTPATPLNFDGEMSPTQEPNRERHGRTQSHAGLLMRTNYDTAPPPEPKPAVKEPAKTRRRARTTSRSHAAPQFALFPTITTTPAGRP